MRARTRTTRPTLGIDAARDYAAVERLLDDLMLGNLDLAGAGLRIREVYDAAFHAGALAHAAAVADKTAQLAAQNRELRIRLVEKSLRESAGVAS